MKKIIDFIQKYSSILIILLIISASVCMLLGFKEINKEGLVCTKNPYDWGMKHILNFEDQCFMPTQIEGFINLSSFTNKT